MTAGKARGQQNTEAGVQVGDQGSENSKSESNGENKLDKEDNKTIQLEAGCPTENAGVALMNSLAKAVDTNHGEYNDDQNTGVGTSGGGEGNDVEELASQKQSQEAGNHTGGDKKALKDSQLCPQKLTDEDED